jgi:hypothetical protein
MINFARVALRRAPLSAHLHIAGLAESDTRPALSHVNRTDLLGGSGCRLAWSGELDTGVALVAHLDARYRMDGNRLDAVVSPPDSWLELSGRGVVRSSASGGIDYRHLVECGVDFPPLV